MLKLNLNAKPFEPKRKITVEGENNIKFDINCNIDLTKVFIWMKQV